MSPSLPSTCQSRSAILLFFSSSAGTTPDNILSLVPPIVRFKLLPITDQKTSTSMNTVEEIFGDNKLDVGENQQQQVCVPFLFNCMVFLVAHIRPPRKVTSLDYSPNLVVLWTPVFWFYFLGIRKHYLVDTWSILLRNWPFIWKNKQKWYTIINNATK